MTDFTIETIRSIYITNQPYQYPMPFMQSASTGSLEYPGNFLPVINTGWHIIPNMLWGHVCSPRQWWEMVLKYEAIRVNSIQCRLFNPIPIQTATSFQGTSTFPAFNNTVYALGYDDDIYETPWFNWWAKPYISSSKQIDLFYEYNPAFKEGLIQNKLEKAYSEATNVPKDRRSYNEPSGVMKYPNYMPTSITASESTMMEKNTYRRQFLPIYWYNFPYKQYKNNSSVALKYDDESSYFEYAYNDISGAFWDPLNRPDALMELRPGKNMINYSWNVEDCDKNIWFNTDRIASLTPYGRPRPLDVSSGGWNAPLKPRDIDPRGPGNFCNRWGYLKEFGFIKQGEQVQVPDTMMAPESHMNVVSWRRWPVVPSRWFYKELQESNPYVYQNMTVRLYSTDMTKCPDMSTAGTGGEKCKAGDVETIGPYQDIKFAGTEYEQHKYPPKQWFIKAVPLYDDAENRIKVEMQMFMHIKINLTGKFRRSAIYAPTWGPIEPMDLYSVNMDTRFGENYMRVRSGGARRTYYDPSDGAPEMMYQPPHPPGQLYAANTAGVDEILVPYNIVDECAVISNAEAEQRNPYGGQYCKNTDKPTLVVTLKSGKRRVLEESSSDISSD